VQINGGFPRLYSVLEGRDDAAETIGSGRVKELYRVDPVEDPRWSTFLDRDPNASIFHSAGWLKALRETYGYEPVVFTTSSPAQVLSGGLLFCHIDSWLTGERMVSVPFSDHCEPLINCIEVWNSIIANLQSEMTKRNWKYIEIRPLKSDLFHEGDAMGFRPAQRYYIHRLDLRPDLTQIRRGFDKNSIVRRVRRAERERLREKCGRSEDLLRDFYDLLILTRIRHSLPPQPYRWFTNLVACLHDRVEIRLAYKEETPIAAILNLRFKNTTYYKYGCLDSRYKGFGGMPFLFWRAIEEAKATGATEFDFGRSDRDNGGLITFKSHFGAAPKSLDYWRFCGSDNLKPIEEQGAGILRRIVPFMPRWLLTSAGKAIYRHIG
jgi:Acetyltransferase (GNAT) domain